MLDLYRYYELPELLDGFHHQHLMPHYIDQMILKCSDIFGDYDLTKDDIEYFKSVEPTIAKDPKLSYDYAYRILKKRFPIGEKSFEKDPIMGVYYIEDLKLPRTPEIEKYIITDAYAASNYAFRVLHSRWREAEDVIATDGISSLLYATNINFRFLKGEPEIHKLSDHDKEYYNDTFGTDL